MLPSARLSVNQIWSRPKRRVAVESPRMLASWELNTRLGPPRIGLRVLEQADQLCNQGGVEAGVEFVGQQDRAVGERLNDWAD